MKKLLGALLALVGYFSVATVISAALGYGYLRHTGKLDDETLFRIAALVHGVDLQAAGHAAEQQPSDVPPEEPSFDDRQRAEQQASLVFDAKQKQLAASLVNFDYQLKQLNATIDQYAKLRAEVEQYLKEQGQIVLNEKIKEVRDQIASLSPTQAKPILLKFIEEQRIDDVIMLLGSMKPKDRQDILKQFKTDDDLEKLYRIQRRMLSGDPTKPFIDEKLKELEQLKSQEK
ncbi:MAG: hypothetical protein DCC67_08615 [Planctomycetota bacterium]|nr:MAG: hypothetical protein DCC67_08615 [Planctomycetota bacterium]